ncbi:MAG: hypothetical protein WC222_07895 [Parachlamydiales bacterium]
MTFLLLSSPLLGQTQEDQSIHYGIDPLPVQVHPWRVGINLGYWSTSGSGHFMRNILKNPGFEGYIDRRIVFVSQSNAQSFSDHSGWGLPDNYWNGAKFEIRSGDHIGTRGTIKKYVQEGLGGAPQFFVDNPLPSLNAKDMIVVTLTVEKDPVPIWWIPVDSKDTIHVDKSTKRPGSAGNQSLRMDPRGNDPARVLFFFDSMSDKGGKLLLVNGRWTFSIWAKAQDPNDHLEIKFLRLNGTQPYLEEKIQLNTEWQQYIVNFNPVDTGPPTTIILSINAYGNTPIWIDDVSLGEVQPGNSPFRKEVIDILTLFHPSFLRDSGPLGDSFENRIAPLSARRTWMMHIAGSNPQPSFSFSIEDHLSLSKDIGANPWIIVPVTWNDSEYKAFGEYLAQANQKYNFSSIIIEFGNENWNWVFRPLGIPYYDVHGQVSDRAFRLIEDSAGAQTPLKKVLNGQDANPWVSDQYMLNAKNFDMMSTAPYYFYYLEQGMNQKKILEDLFAPEYGQMTGNAEVAKNHGKELSIYEINMHTTLGNLPAKERNSYVSGQAAGAALAQNILNAMLLGYNPIMASNFAQYGYFLAEIQDYVNLWGLMRDIITTKRMRPTGMAVMMLNYVIGGKMFRTNLKTIDKQPQAQKIVIGAFQYGTQWTAAATNGNDEPQTVTIEFPYDSNTLPKLAIWLQSTSPISTNEDAQDVTFGSAPTQITERDVTFTLPSYGFVILSPGTPSP